MDYLQTITNWLSIIGTLGPIGTAFFWIHKKGKEPEVAAQALESHFYVKHKKVEQKRYSEQDKLEAKGALYSASPLADTITDNLAPRDLIAAITEELVAQEKNFLHIHVGCKIPRQGISSLLRYMNQSLAVDGEFVLLYAKDFRGQHRAYQLSQLKRLTPFSRLPKFIRKLLNAKTHIIILLDDAFSGNNQDIQSQLQFIRHLESELTESNPTHQKVTIVTGNHSTEPILGAINLELKLTTADEISIYNKIFNEEPTLAPAITHGIEAFWGWAKGKDEYGNDLLLFLSLLHEFASKEEIVPYWRNCYEVPNELKELLDIEKRMLLSALATYSLLDIPIDIRTLSNITKQKQKLDWLSSLPWATLSSTETKFKLQRGQARNILREYSINFTDEFLNECKRIYRWDVNFENWSPSEHELLRHLFRRLCDERYRQIKLDDETVIDGAGIAQTLYSLTKVDIECYLTASTSVELLCRWVNTIRNLQDWELARKLLERIPHLCTNSISDPESFVSFGSTLAAYGKKHTRKQKIISSATGKQEKKSFTLNPRDLTLIKSGLKVLDFDTAFNLSNNHDVRRRYAVITTWHSLLLLISPAQAEYFIENHHQYLDARGLDQIAKSSTNPKKRLAYYKEAREKAFQEIRHHPGGYIKQVIRYHEITDYKESDALDDIIRLVDIVGNPRYCRFPEGDIRGLQRAVNTILHCNASLIQDKELTKLNNFLLQ